MIQVTIMCDLPTINNLIICAVALAMDDSTLDPMLFPPYESLGLLSSPKYVRPLRLAYIYIYVE